MRTAKQRRDSIRSDAQDVTTIKTINFTNVKKLKTDGKRPKIWSASNFDLNYSFIVTERHNPLIEFDELRRTRAAVGYNYAPQPLYLEPFKKLINQSRSGSLLSRISISILFRRSYHSGLMYSASSALPA